MDGERCARREVLVAVAGREDTMKQVERRASGECELGEHFRHLSIIMRSSGVFLPFWVQKKIRNCNKKIVIRK